MIKAILIATLYFLIGLGICSGMKSNKKDDYGFIVFVMMFWPVIIGLLLLIVVLALICAGITWLTDKQGE